MTAYNDDSLDEQDLRYRSESVAGDVDNNPEPGDSWISDQPSPNTTSSASSVGSSASLSTTGPTSGSNISAVEFSNALSNVRFPASREDLIQQVSNNNDSKITTILQKFPQQQFNSINEVQQAYKKISGAA